MPHYDQNFGILLFKKPIFGGCGTQGGEGSIWRHLVAIADLGRSPMHPKTAMTARWRQIEPSLLKLSDKNHIKPKKFYMSCAVSIWQ